jgi:hypothetical protein
MLSGLRMKFKRRRVSSVLPEHHEVFARLLGRDADPGQHPPVPLLGKRALPITSQFQWESCPGSLSSLSSEDLDPTAPQGAPVSVLDLRKVHLRVKEAWSAPIL